MFGSGLDLLFGFIILFLLVANFFVLNRLAKKYVPFSYRVFIALGMAIVEGILFNVFVYSNFAETDLNMAKQWLVLFGSGFVDLLKMIAIPIIFVSIFGAFTKMSSGKSAGKIAGLSILILLATTAIAAVVGILVTKGFNLNAGEIVNAEITPETCELVSATPQDYDEYLIQACSLGEYREGKADTINTFPELLRTFVPKDAIYAFTGQAANSTLKVVIFTALLGMAYLGIKRKKPQEASTIETGFNALHALIMRLTTIVLRLTPYGVFALMFKVFAFTGWEAVVPLGKFLAASYVSIIIMFLIHGVILALNGLNPFKYYAKGAKTLLFAFTSRSSAATVPLNIDTQENSFGVSPAVASTSASFGTSVGQNGCAGIYPAMLVTMVYATGVIPGIGFGSYLTLVLIVTLTSLGIAGIGGGATFAAVAVFSAMGLDEWLWLTGILVGVEGLIDMARTSLNVSGSMVSGVLTAKYTGELDMSTYNASIDQSDSSSIEL